MEELVFDNRLGLLPGEAHPVPPDHLPDFNHCPCGNCSNREPSHDHLQCPEEASTPVQVLSNLTGHQWHYYRNICSSHVPLAVRRGKNCAMGTRRSDVQLDSLPHHHGHPCQQHNVSLHCFGPLYGRGKSVKEFLGAKSSGLCHWNDLCMGMWGWDRQSHVVRVLYRWHYCGWDWPQ